MNSHDDKPQSLGEMLRAARTAKALSIRDLSTSSGVARSTLLDLEQDNMAAPNPHHLKSLAQSLDLNLTDLYAIAGYVPATGLPSFAPYLRSKYGHLPDEARNELEASFGLIADKYGYDPAGPSPGEDEDHPNQQPPTTKGGIHDIINKLIVGP
jgi:transcriptional regulator with XRE-family HTH domain